MSQLENAKRAAMLGTAPAPQSESKPTLAQRYLSNWQENFAQRQPFSSAVASLWREAVKDVRGTMNEVFFGQGEHASEPGTPLNPTMQMITSEITGKEIKKEIDLDLEP
jgi:hypothetical protein